MADEGAKPDKQLVVDAIVLCFTHSKAVEFVGTDAFRSVVSVEYHDIAGSGVFDLQLVWELLEEQPGFLPEAVVPPMAVFKSWEERLGLEVTLPDVIKDFSPRDLALYSADCKVPPAEYKTLFLSVEEKKNEQVKEKEKAKARASIEATAASAEERRFAKPWMMHAAIVVLLGSAATIAFTLYSHCGSGVQWQAFSAADIGDQIPVKSVKRLGKQVIVTVEDANWLAASEEAQRTQLEASLRDIEHKGIDVLVILDASGVVRATSQLSHGRIKTRFVPPNRGP